MTESSVDEQVRAAYAGFAAFGAFWGAWGASVPAIRDQAGLSNGQLGTALLFVGVGALPAMLLTGRAVDRWGRSVTAVLLLALGGTGVAVALTGQGMRSLCVGLLVLGAASGAADVAINAAAGSAERASTRPVITRAHGVFSACVVVASLGTGLLTSLGSPVVLPFVVVAAVAGAAATTVRASAERRGPHPGAAPAEGDYRAGPDRRPAGSGRLPLLPLLVTGGLAAVAFAVENAHQSWSAVYLGDVLSAGPIVAAAGPADFAAVSAVTRFLLGAARTAHASAVLLGGAAAAAAGTTVLATSGSVTVALIGLGLAAAGTAVLYPTLLGLGTARVPEAARGAATSVVATLAYLGFLAGPVYVGGWAAATDLPGAMLAVAALAAGFGVLGWAALHTVIPPGRARHHPDPAPPREATADRPEADVRTEHAAYRMFARNTADYADPAMVELAWTDPAIRAFWLAQARAVASDLRDRP
jgi:MFS family permease